MTALKYTSVLMMGFWDYLPHTYIADHNLSNSSYVGMGGI